MTKPDWNKKQHPEQKSPEHGKKDHGHGPGEHGYGALRDLDLEHGPKQKPDDLTIQEPDEGTGTPTDIGGPMAGTSFPSSFYVADPPPVQNQGTTPHCVAYSNAYDQNQHDRRDNVTNTFKNFDEAKFFAQIGGTSAGAYMNKGLARRRDYGYPEAVNVSGQDSNPDSGRHRIASYTAIALTVTAIKEALMRGHGVLVIGDWFHSWNHPLASGKLPAPDYRVAGHARWWRGWNDAYGFRERESFGTGWGPIGGDCFVPYAYLNRLYAAYRTTDK